MTLDRKSLGINLNTVISALTLVVMLGGWIYYWANTVRDIEELKDKWVDHDKTVEQRLIENRTRNGQMDERMRAVENKAIDLDKKQGELFYRVTVLETDLAAQRQQSQKVADDLAELRGDVKVVKKILEDMQAASTRRRPP